MVSSAIHRTFLSKTGMLILKVKKVERRHDTAEGRFVIIVLILEIFQLEKTFF